MRPTATDLVQWSDGLESRARLPELVRRLINATTSDLDHPADFPAGEGIQKHGVDGRVIRGSSISNPFVPAGASVWELGTSEDVRSKANRDYAKRMEALPVGIDPRRTTYVCVTARRFPGKDSWALAKRDEGCWADVRAYDADTLEQWLELAPPAAAWLSGLLGTPTDALSLEESWREWSARTSPPTVEALVIAGRHTIEDAMLRWLNDSPRLVTATTPDPMEAAAFLLATLRRRSPMNRDHLLDRTVVVSSDNALRRVADEGRRLIIVALDCKLEVGRLAAQRGHHVLHASPRAAPGERIPLGPADVRAVAAVLERMGLNDGDAARLANESHGHLAALRRLLGDVPREEFEPDLVPLLLVGAWDEARTGDVDVVLRVFARDRSTLDELMRRSSLGPDAPLRWTGRIWSWVSRLDAWKQVAHAIVPRDMDRFCGAALEVLTIPDPRFELEPERRVMAPVLDKVLPHSEPLREGLVEGIALLATESSSLAPGLPGQQVADRIVQELLAALDTWQKWATLDDSLPVLAESSPTAFLDRVTRLLDRETEIVETLFRPQRSVWGRERLANGIVWALETIAWVSEFLPPATDLLARLAAIELAQTPGEKSRALDSLKEIFLPWLPHTVANIEERRAALTRLCKRHSGVGFALVLRLVEQSEFSNGTRKPRYRQWLSEWRDDVSEQDASRMQLEIEGLLIAGATAVPSRWSAVVPNLGNLSTEARDRILAALEALDVSLLADEERVPLRVALRRELRRQRMFRDEDWVLSESQLAPLDSLYSRLEPSDVRQRFAWLFDPAAELPDFAGTDLEELGRALVSSRELAARELAAHLSPRALIAFARTVENAALLGSALASTDSDGGMIARLVTELVGLEEDHARDLRDGIVGKAFQKHGYGCVELLGAARLGPIDRATLAMALPSQDQTWSLVETWGPDAVDYFWRNARHWQFWNPQRDLRRALVALLNVGRAGQALHLAALWATGPHAKVSLEPDLVARILTAAGETRDDREAMPPRGYQVGELLRTLHSAGEEWQADRRRLEFRWFPVLRGARYQPESLFKELEDNHEPFVELVSWLFRAEDEHRREPSVDEARRAEVAFDLLHAWRGFPGSGEGNAVDAGHLGRWVRGAREKLRSGRRASVGDLQIGAVLARSPSGLDGYWPHEAVRDLFEQLDDISDIASGFTTGRRNMRSVHGRGLAEGGGQERAIARTYRLHAGELRRRWPVVAGVLDSLAESYERDAGRQDVRAAQDTEAIVWSALTEDRLGAFVDELQAGGRYTFTLAEAAAGIQRSEAEVRPAASKLAERSRLAAPQSGFYVIVPLEYRSAGAPPPPWYIDNWMRWAGQSYYVGMLSAAALHGAGHQQPNAFQVIVGDERPGVKVGRTEIEFLQADDVERVHTLTLKTETGEMRVSTAETTALDLVRHIELAGGIDAVATVLSELGEEIDEQKLAAAAAHYELPVVQRTGWLLERVGFTTKTGQLREQRRLPESEPWPVDGDVDVEVDA